MGKAVRIYAKIGTHSGEVVIARRVPRSRCPNNVNRGKQLERFASPGDWIEIKKTAHGSKWEGPLKLHEIRNHGDGLYVISWI